MTPEGMVLKSITDYLTARRIWHRRMNSGAVVSEHKGKRRFHRYGSVGMSDVMAYHRGEVIWLEAKTATGRQSESQNEFEREVMAEGMRYFVVRSIEDVEYALSSIK